MYILSTINFQAIAIDNSNYHSAESHHSFICDIFPRLQTLPRFGVPAQYYRMKSPQPRY